MTVCSIIEGNFIHHICNLNLQLPTVQVPPDCDPVFDELIKACWKHNPSSRSGILLLFQFNTHTDHTAYNRPTFETIVKKLSEYQKKLQTLYGDHAFELQQDTDDSDDDSDDSDDDDDDANGGQNEFAVFKMERMDKIQRKVDHFWKALLDEGKSLRSIHAAILAAADKVMQLKHSNNGPSKSCVESGQQQHEEEEEDVESKRLLTDDAYVSIDTGHQPNMVVVEDVTVEGYYTVEGCSFGGAVGNAGQDSATTTSTSTTVTADGCSDTYVEINM